MECNIDYRKDNRWTVYVHIVPKTLSGYDWDKYYVGITSRTTNKRWGKNGNNYKEQFFYKAIKKYGWDNIQHEIVAEHLTEDEAKSMEISLIAQLNSNNSNYGYNITSGGDLNDDRSMQVDQYDKNGYFIRSYSSIYEASIISGVNENTISQACYGILNRAGEYQWKFVEDINNIPIRIEAYKEYIHPHKKVLQYDIYGNFIRIWDGVSEICKELGVSKGALKGCLCGYTKSCYGYQWKWENDIKKVENVSEKVRLKNREFYQYDVNGNFIKSFTNIQEKATELNDPNFLKTIYNKFRDITNNFYYGYRWTNKYYEKLPPLSEKGLKQVKRYERKN